MFPSKPLIDLSASGYPYVSNDINTLFITIGVWCFGWSIFYLGRKNFNESIDYVAFMAVITPTLTIVFSSGILFWSLILMTVINIAAWLYCTIKSESNTPKIS